MTQTPEMLTVSKLEPNLFQLGSVRPGTADRAFPIARMFEPTLDLTAWRAYVRDQTRRAKHGGIMCLEDPRGYVHGVFSWSVRKLLAPGRVLRVCDILLLQLPGQALQAAVVDHLASLASAKNCRTIILEIQDQGRPLGLEGLHGLGFRRLPDQSFAFDL